jgi:hypothetical protein
MSLSGPEILRAVEEALRDVRREEDESLRRLARAVELSTKLHAQEGDLYRQLAAERLDAAARSELSARIAEAEQRATSTLRQHDAALSEAQAQLARLDAGLAQASATRATQQIEAAKRAGELAELAAKARPRLGTDPDYAGKLAAANQAAAIAERARTKVLEAEAERERKGRPFRDDRLFMYLWGRGYGSGNYRANPLVSWLDARLARFIGYDRARTSFSLANALPLRLGEHAERAAARARAAADEIAALENIAVDSAGGRAAREALEAAVGRIDALDHDMLALQDQRDEAMQVARELAQGSDAATSAALDEIARLLARPDIKALLAEARATPKGQDAVVLQQFSELRQRAIEETAEAREQRSRLRVLGARRRDLEDIQYEIKARGFDNPHSGVLDARLAADELNALLRAGINAATYWERLQQAQTWDSAALHGGPGGGWGYLPRPAASGLSRPRAPKLAPAA